MKNSKILIILLTVLVSMLSVHAASAQSKRTKKTSATSSATSDIRVTKENRSDPSASCMAAAIELEKTRVLVRELNEQNNALSERLDTEKGINAVLIELDNSRRSETELLKKVVAAKNETLAEKDKVISTQEKLIAGLKEKRPSPWRRLGDVLIGAAAVLVLK